eukprot:TRINITY_DN27533_c0_g1_i1.p2 TRINITY_DN27533_c0_g1~~TRINITY_DN27533_c0_g1_i1.p2  ORF type:complete len:211 (+),score=77.18 TRINITY_DN27533_c0_g1_i1:78-710(+)
MDRDMKELRSSLRETDKKPKDWPDETLADQEKLPAEAPTAEEEAPEQDAADEPTQAVPRLTEREVAAAFDLFDADGKGALRGVDLECALQGLGVETEALGVEDAEVDLAEFTQLVHANTHPANSKEEIMYVFGTFDKSHTGELTIPDILETVSTFDPRATAEEVAEVVKYITGDNHGVITAEDLTRTTLAVSELTTRVQRRYGIVDGAAA